MADTKKLYNSTVNRTALLTAASLDFATISTIFSLIIKQTLEVFLKSTAKYVFFPIAGAMNLASTILSWRQYHLENHERSLLLRAAVETIGALAIMTAVIGGIFFSTAFAIASPAIFSSVLLAKIGMNLGFSIYHFYHAVKSNNPAERQQHLKAFKENLVASVAIALATSAVLGVMLFAQPGMAALGLIGGITGVMFCAYKIADLWRNYHAAKPAVAIAIPAQIETAETEKKLTSNAKISQKLKVTPTSGMEILEERTPAAVFEQPQSYLVQEEITPAPRTMEIPRPLY